MIPVVGKGGSQADFVSASTLSRFFAPNHDFQLPFWLGMRMRGNSSSSGVRNSAEPDDVEEEEPLVTSCVGTAFRESELNILVFRFVASCGGGSMLLDDGASGLSARLAKKTEDMRRMLVVVGNVKSEDMQKKATLNALEHYKWDWKLMM